MGCVNTRRWKQDSCLLDMGGFMTSEWVITLVFFLYSNFSRHFTRLRHTIKGVILCCFSLLHIADIGWMFCRMLHCFGLFFYSGQFKSCFPHHKSLCEIRGFCFLACQFYPHVYPYGFLRAYAAPIRGPHRSFASGQRSHVSWSQ